MRPYQLVELLPDQAILPAYNALAQVRRTETVEEFSDPLVGRYRLVFLIGSLLPKYNIEIGEDGAAVATCLTTESSNEKDQSAMTRIEDLSAEALQVAAVQLAALLPPGTKLAADDDGSPSRVEEALELLSPTLSVTIAADGTVSSSPLSRIVVEPSEARVSPGLARMRARLGTEGTEELRQKVLADGDVALQAAAKRSDHLSEINQDAGGDAGMAAALASVRDKANPDLAGAVAQAVSKAQAARDKPVDELNKLLSRELQPQAREILRTHIAAALASKSSAPTQANSAPAPRAEPAKPRSTGRGKAPTYAENAVITVKVPAGTNPKRAGAAKRFACYETGMTVAEYAAKIEGGMPQAIRDLTWDTGQGFVEVTAS